MSYNLGYYTNTSNPGGTTPLRSFPGSEGYAAGPTGGGQSLGPSRGAYQPYSTTAKPIRRFGGFGASPGGFASFGEYATNTPHWGADLANRMQQAGAAEAQGKNATQQVLNQNRLSQSGFAAGSPQAQELAEMGQGQVAQQVAQNNLGIDTSRMQFNAGNELQAQGQKFQQHVGVIGADAEAMKARQDYLLGLQRLYAPGTPGGPVASAFGAIG